MRLSDIKGEKALDVIADLLDPVAEISTDNEVRTLLETGKVEDRKKAIKLGIKNHKKAVITMLAILNGEDPETYEPSIYVLPVMLLDILNDPEVQRLFGSQEQTSDGISSGPVQENTEEA